MEPPGAAHVDPELTFENVDRNINQALKKLEGKPADELLEERYRKFRAMGVFTQK
jgi:acetyl-CoA carboxylase carboxyl transferase subunit alpha